MNFEESSVLIVDDIEDNRDLLSRRLTRLGHTVLMANNGKEAIAQLDQHNIDVILCDIMMPEMNGYQLLEHLKASPDFRHIPVIMVSALSEMDSIVRCIELGAEDYLLKPFNPTILRARVSASLEKKRLRDQEQAYAKQLAQANQEISALNERLQADNLRMSAELDVARRIQQMILPKQDELQCIEELEIAAYMEPTLEVGGDYYDVLQYGGGLQIGIGDVTGHGIDSGVVMLMAQTAVRTLLMHGETDLVQLLNTVNRVIYNNTQRMGALKPMTLALIEYHAGMLRLSGQHEELLIVRRDGQIDVKDTFDLGFPLGLEPDISSFTAEIKIELHPGDVAVLYTDGITEAMDLERKLYGTQRLHAVVQHYRDRSAAEIQQQVIADVRQHLGSQRMFDDITLLVFKRR